MPRANRTLKGNKRRGVHDRLIVPKNGYKVHVDPPQLTPPDLPEVEVGQKCSILNVIIHEVSISYEGKAQRFVKKIKFSDIVGNPVTYEQLDKGYTFKTPQGETLLVKWHLANKREDQGLIVHNLKAEGTSYYEPNWGQVYGVGMEWLACDGSQGGTIWANRHIGNTTHSGSQMMDDFTWDENVYTNYPREPEYALHAIRPGLMLGNPEPERALWLMGQELPLRVYPALGKVGQGCIFGFNKNVMKFVQVKPPEPVWLKFTGAATARNDAVGISWQKDEFHQGFTQVGAILIEQGIMQSMTPAYSPNEKGVMLLAKPSKAQKGTGGISNIKFPNREAGRTVFRLLLLECDESGVPQYVLDATDNIWDWSAGGGVYTNVPYDEDHLPYPRKPAQLCAGVEPPPSGGGGTTPTDPSTPVPSDNLQYFCNGSVPVTSISTDYWVGDKALAPDIAAAVQSQFGVTFNPKFWEGRNSWLEFFAKMDGSTPYRNSKISTVLPFHTFLYKLIEDKKNGTAPVDMADMTDFTDFKTWCINNGLSCLSDLQKASMFMSYHMEVPVNFFQPASGYLSGDILTIMLDNLILLPKGIYDWIDFNEVAYDSQGSITGAFAADYPDVRFKAFTSFVNFEPQALQYTIGAAKAHRPTDYVKASGSMWGTTTNVDYTSYWMNNMTDANFMPYVAAEVGIHEIGHCVAYYGLDHYGQVLHEMPDWLAISGWSSNAPSYDPSDVSKHLVKTRSASQTGGMPKTDAGYEAPVSDYGCFHPAEDFADAFRLYILNPTFLEAKYPQKYRFMVDKVEPMFP